MSTNFFLRRLDQVSGDVSIVHVGLSTTNGFTFAAHPALGITCLEGWKRLFNEEDSVLFDEYERERNKDMFLALVARKRDEAMADPNNRFYHNTPELPSGQSYMPDKRYRDAQGYVFNGYEFS